MFWLPSYKMSNRMDLRKWLVYFQTRCTWFRTSKQIQKWKIVWQKINFSDFSQFLILLYHFFISYSVFILEPWLDIVGDLMFYVNYMLSFLESSLKLVRVWAFHILPYLMMEYVFSMQNRVNICCDLWFDEWQEFEILHTNVRCKYLCL